jgi:hypothetical protein
MVSFSTCDEAASCVLIPCWAVIQGSSRRQKREEGLALQEAKAWVGLGFKVGVSSEEEFLKTATLRSARLGAPLHGPYRVNGEGKRVSGGSGRRRVWLAHRTRQPSQAFLVRRSCREKGYEKRLKIAPGDAEGSRVCFCAHVQARWRTGSARSCFKEDAHGVGSTHEPNAHLGQQMQIHACLYLS